MDTIEEKLQKLPRVKPSEDFVTYLEETLVEKHILLSRKKKAKNFGILPVYALGGFLALIIIYSGIICKNYYFPTDTKNTISSLMVTDQKDRSQQEKIAFDSNNPTKSASSYSNQSVNTFFGYLVVSNSNSELYELRNKEEITYYVSGDLNLLKLFKNKEIEIKGYLEGSFDNINIIKIDQIELK